MEFWRLNDGASPALLQDGNAISYAALRRDADHAVSQLPDFGRRGFGFLLFDHHVSLVCLYIGCLRSADHVPLLLQPDIHAELLRSLTAHYQPDWIAAPAEVAPPPGYIESWRAEGCRVYEPSKPAPPVLLHADLAVLLSTSGSTGSRKLVRLSYDALASNANAIAAYLELQADDRAITTVPLGYSFGMSIINSHLAVGASVVLTRETLMSRDFWNLAAASEITSLSGVPSSFDMMRRAGIERRGLSRLRSLTQAGGRLRDPLVAHFDELCRAHGWRFYVMYGQTEAGPRISYVPPTRLADKIGSIGVAIPGGTLMIDDANNELIYRGPNVMMGYAETREDLARGDDLGGVLRTGDLGRQDAEGFVYLSGRLSRFVKMAGARINLDVIEQALATKLCSPCAATGMDDALKIWLEHHSDVADAEIRTRLREWFNIFPGAVEICRVAEIPLLPNGKLDYRALEKAK